MPDGNVSIDTIHGPPFTCAPCGEREMSTSFPRKYVNRKGFVLIQEDDVQIRELLERWLHEAGYAISAAEDEVPCLVIADVPEPSRAHAHIRSLQAVYAAPVLVMSGRFRRGLAESAAAAHRLGVKKVLPKPFTRKELLSAVAASLEEH